MLFDGGLGTGLIQRGLEPGEAPESWNLERPGQVLDLHAAYVEAGSRVIETNTFGANALRLRAAGAGISAREAIAAACGLALEAADGRALVAGSIGPLGELVDPYGPVSVDVARATYAEVIETMQTYGIEVVVIETMLSLDEALIALRQALIAGVPAVGVSMNFDVTPKGPRTAFGESPTDVVTRLQDAGAHFVGSNCGAGLDTMTLVARELMSAAAVPVLIQANAGIPTTVEGRLHYPETPETFSAFVDRITDMGVRLVGGCCGTGPEHIRQIRKVIG